MERVLFCLFVSDISDLLLQKGAIISLQIPLTDIVKKKLLIDLSIAKA